MKGNGRDPLACRLEMFVERQGFIFILGRWQRSFRTGMEGLAFAAYREDPDARSGQKDNSLAYGIWGSPLRGPHCVSLLMVGGV